MRCIAAPYFREKRLKGRTKGQTVFENTPAGGLRPAGFMAAAQGGKRPSECAKGGLSLKTTSEKRFPVVHEPGTVF